jgi:hypothetical protein
VKVESGHFVGISSEWMVGPAVLNRDRERLVRTAS